MADTLFLRKGTLANLKNAPILNGSINITTDEPGIYVDFDNKRKRVGDVITVPSLDKIVVDKENWTGVVEDAAGMVSTWSNTALYYVEQGNHLLKFVPPAEGENILNGSWVKINNTADIEADLTALETALDTFKTEVSTTYETKENANSKWAAQAVKDKAQDDALTAETERAVAAEEALAEDISDLDDSLKAHVEEAAKTYETKTDAQTKFNTNATAITNEAATARAAEQKLTADLAAEVKRAGEAEQALTDALQAHETEAAKTYETITNVNTIKTNLEKSVSDEVARATKAEGDLSTALTEEVARAKKAEQDNADAISALETEVAQTYETKESAADTKEELEGKITEEATTARAAEKKLTDDLAAEIARAKEAEQDLTDELDALTGTLTGDYALKSELTAVDQRLTQAVADEATAARAAEKKLGEDLAAEAARAKKAEKDNADAIASNYNTLDTKIDDSVSAINAKIGTIGDDSSKATVYGELKKYTDDKMVAADAMKFMGVADTISELGIVGNDGMDPVEKGWTYKVGTIINNFTPVDGSARTVYVGDLLIAAADQAAGQSPNDYNGGWYHISSGYEDDYNPSLSNDTANNTIILKDTVHESHGSVQFLTNENSNVQITMTGEPDAATQIADTKITLTMVWGEFPTQA